MQCLPGWAALLLGTVWAMQSPAQNAPFYSAQSIVHAATNKSGRFAPYGIGTIYGRGLATATAGAAASDVTAGTLPYYFNGTCSRVAIDNIPAPLLFVSPTQINFLVPSNMRTGKRYLQVLCDSLAGPKAELEIIDAEPGLFQLDAATLIAVHTNGQLCSVENPAKANEVVLLFGTGLGRTIPLPAGPGALATIAAQVENINDFRILINGEVLPSNAVLYAGLAPGFAGLYQINLRLPANVDSVAEVQLRMGSETSPAGLRLPVEKVVKP